MSESEKALNPKLLAAKKGQENAFFKKGLIIAMLGGMSYGLFSAFVTYAMGKGIWAEWYGPNTMLSLFATTYLLGTLGSAVNDTCSAIWAILIATVKGKIGDFFRTINTKPGRIMIMAALVGGPISSTAYIVSLQMAGSIIIPITALCPAIASILGKILFKQEINKRMWFGIAICFLSTLMIGSTGFGMDAPENTLLGLCIALIAAFGWGLEGCVAGYGTSMIDYEIGITIRQVTSGLSNLIILVPLFGVLSGIGASGAFGMAMTAFTDGPSIIFFAISGLCALFAFSLWYKGNSMCGVALGMACNGTYSFWGPFFCWIVLGVFAGMDGWALPPIVWASAVVMAIGILLISMNPLDLFKKKEA